MVTLRMVTLRIPRQNEASVMGKSSGFTDNPQPASASWTGCRNSKSIPMISSHRPGKVEAGENHIRYCPGFTVPSSNTHQLSRPV